MKKIKVGIIGCGSISDIYLKNLPRFEAIELVCCADLDNERANQKAVQYGIQSLSVEELIASPDIELVLNLTIPSAHAEVSLKALHAGKHVYIEKPLATSREDGQKILELANQKGLYVGSAPDTVLGGGIQTCKKIIADGWIGKPVAATAFMMGHGPEGWHPNPDFFYQPGGGPLFDMGPYYISALINLIGPIKQVSGMASISFPERTVTSLENFGATISVNTPTHISGNLEFRNGAVGTLITSFDVWGSNTPFIEIHGTRGSLSVPDPNTFGGPVKLKKQGDSEWVEFPLAYKYTENFRGIGVADMADAILSNRKHRANGELGYHILDVMFSILESAKQGKHIQIDSVCEQPEPLPLGLLEGYIK